MLVMLSAPRQFLLTHSTETDEFHILLSRIVTSCHFCIFWLSSYDEKTKGTIFWMKIDFKNKILCLIWLYPISALFLFLSSQLTSCLLIPAAKVVIMKLQTNQNLRKVITNNLALGLVSTWSSSHNNTLSAGSSEQWREHGGVELKYVDVSHVSPTSHNMECALSRWYSSRPRSGSY